MTWPVLLNLVGYGVIFLGIILLIVSLLRKGVSVVGVALLFVGLVLLVVAAFLE